MGAAMLDSWYTGNAGGGSLDAGAGAIGRGAGKMSIGFESICASA